MKGSIIIRSLGAFKELGISDISYFLATLQFTILIYHEWFAPFCSDNEWTSASHLRQSYL